MLPFTCNGRTPGAREVVYRCQEKVKGGVGGGGGGGGGGGRIER